MSHLELAIEDRFGEKEMFAEPFAYYAALRDEAPAFYSPTLGAYVVTRYDDAVRVLTNPQVFSSFPAGASPTAMAAFAPEYHTIYTDKGTWPPLPTLVITDGEVHRRYRGTVEKAFSQEAVRGMEASIRMLVDALIDNFIADGAVDLYKALCLKLPSFVMCDVIGLPREAAPLLKRGADTSPRLASSALESEESRRALNGERADMYVYIQSFIEKYRAEPQDNLLSRIIHTDPSDGVPLTVQELISIAGTLNVGGNETTTNGLGNMFYRAFLDPEALGSARAEPARFVEETLRLESAVSAMPRWVMADTEIDGVAIPAGARLFVSFLAANNDERKFACPHQLDAKRAAVRNHVAFGAGPHFCLGAPLARLEMKVALERVLDRLADIRLDPAIPIRRQQKMIVRGIENLPILFTAAKSERVLF
jgi:cytochrome P450